MIVAEKPSTAQAYAKVLGATSRQDGYLEGNGYLVSWCIGHLVELAPPNVYDEKYVKWSIADLPILPQKWQYLVSASTKKQFGILQKLMNRPDVDVDVSDFDSFWNRYVSYLQSYSFPLLVKSPIEVYPYPDAAARVASTILSRDDYDFPVYFVAFKIPR